MLLPPSFSLSPSLRRDIIYLLPAYKSRCAKQCRADLTINRTLYPRADFNAYVI